MAIRPGVAAVAVAVAFVVATGPGGVPAAHGGGQEDAVLAGQDRLIDSQIDRWFLEGMDAIYRGLPSEAERIAQEMLRLAPEDPRPYLFEARVLRLDVPDQNSRREGLESRIDPILEVLDRAIAASEAILQRDPESVPGHLYRGWALMFKAQLHALAGEYWGAGQRAKAGKRDLDFVLTQEPGNADALLIQGVYLYFADVLPATVKLARFFVGIPGGHRVRGLEYMEAAGMRQGYSRLDARAIYGVVLFGFEGRFEDAIAQLEGVEAEYPDNPRMEEPVAVMDLFLPDRLGAALPHLESATQQNASSTEPWERKVAARLRFYLALGQMLAGRLEAARDNLDLLRRERPEDPDWFEADVVKALVDVELMLGEQSQAEKIVAAYPEDHRLRRELRYALQPGSAASTAASAALIELQPALRALYDGDLQAAALALEGVRGLSSPFVAFYAGELAFLGGRHAEALQHYESLIDAELPARWEWFRNFAYLRAAEVHGQLGHDGAASHVLSDFVSQYDTRDLLRHVAKARRRYFENGKPSGAAVARAPGASAVESR